MFPSLIWDKRETGKKLYLTFDDGPTPGVTSKILDLLDQFNAKATFFCLGRNVDRHPELFREILTRKHAVGNHTYSHLKGWKTCSQEYYKDIELSSRLINSKLFRPPYGQIKRSQIKFLKRKYQIMMWDVMSHDYNPNISKKRCLRAVLRYSKNGSILVFHDSEKASEKVLYILPVLLKRFAKKGYTFESLQEKE